jgi:hypothetical protein
LIFSIHLGETIIIKIELDFSNLELHDSSIHSGEDDASLVITKSHTTLILFRQIVGKIVSTILVCGSVLPGSRRTEDIDSHLFVSFGMNIVWHTLTVPVVRGDTKPEIL